MKSYVVRFLGIFILALALVGCPPTTTPDPDDTNTPPAQVKVPFLVGQTISAAETAIQSSGLILGSRLRENSDSVPVDYIVRQEPPGGTRVARNSAVKLVLSLGPVTAVVPSLSNVTRADAEAEIVAAGLQVGNVLEQFSRTVPIGLVIGQEPPAGSRVTMNNAVLLIISKGPAISVPNVVGTSLSSATERLTNAGLRAGRVSVGYSDTIPIAQVMSQSPAAGGEAAPQSMVAMVVSGGIAPIPVPDVVGKTLALAQSTLLNVGLRLGPTTEEYSEEVPVGRVISQNPPANADASPSSLITVVISRGPTPIVVPDVVGKTRTIAERDLNGARLVVGAITEAFSSTVAIGRVISQDPAAGEELLPGEEVALVLSKGIMLVTVPNVVGLSRSEAQSALESRELILGNVSEQFNETIPAGEIISQNPVADSSIGSGLPVSIVVSLGPQTSETSETVNGGGVSIELDDLTLTLPEDSLEQSRTITVARNRPGTFVDRGNNDRNVTQVYQLEQDRGAPLFSSGEPFRIHLAFDEGAITLEEGEALNDITVFLRVTTPDASFRISGTLTDGGLLVTTDTLPEEASIQIVFNPYMRAVFSDIDDEKDLTQNAPWRTTRFRCTYDERNAVLIQAVAAALELSLSEVTDVVLGTAMREMVANNARDGAKYLEALGLREADLRVVETATPPYFDIHMDAYRNASHFLDGSIAWNQLSVDTERLNPASSDPLGTVRNGIGHDLFHASFNGYDFEMGPNNIFVAGVHESLGALVGHSLEEGGIGQLSNEAHRLSDTIGLSDAFCNELGCSYSEVAYKSIDWFAYIGKRFNASSLSYLGKQDTDGLLEELRIENGLGRPANQAGALTQLRRAMHATFEAQFGQPLSEIYWDYARNRAYERNDESRLNAADEALPRFELNAELFEETHVLSYVFGSAEQRITISADAVPGLRDIPPLTSRALIFNGTGLDADLSLRFNRADWIADELGNSMMVKVYKVGSNGVELPAEDDSIHLTGFGDVDETASSTVVVLLSNVSLDKTYSVSVDASTSVATGGFGSLAGQISNPVTDGPIPGVDIAVRGRNFGDDDSIIATGVSDANGQFVFEELPSGYVEFTFSKDGQIETVQTATVVSDVTAQLSASLVVTASAFPTGNASGKVINNVTGGVINGVALELRPGILRLRDTDYEVVATTSTDANGNYSFSDLAAGTYTAFATRTGFVNATFVVFVVGNTTQANQDGDMSTTVNIGTIRIVLTWGQVPSDLDSHLTGPSASGRFHVWYGDRQAGTADLDLDDVSSFGPETTTIRSRVPGTYRFSVHDFTNLGSGSSRTMSNSGAKVRVITEFGTSEFNITPNTPATLWTVFEIDGVSGAITEIDDYSFTSDPGAVSKSLGWRYGLGSEVPQTISRDLRAK